MSPRQYDLGRRRGAADATRTKILDATRALVGGKGDLDDFSMDAVAARAGVSRMTVYNQFRSQAGLLEALADQLAERGGMQRMAEVFFEPRPDEAIRRFVGTFVGFWASDRLLLRRLRAMGVLVPGVYRGVRDRDLWRREAAKSLLLKIGLRSATDRSPDGEAMTDLLAALTSFEVFDGLCDEKRPPEAVARLISETILNLWGPALLHAHPGRPPDRPKSVRRARGAA